MSLARPQDPRALLRGSGPPYPLPTRLLSHSARRAGAGTQGPLPPAPKPGVAGAGGRRARCGSPRRGSLLVAAALGNGGSYEPYPWDEREYHRVALQMVQVGAAPVGIRLLTCLPRSSCVGWFPGCWVVDFMGHGAAPRACRRPGSALQHRQPAGMWVPPLPADQRPPGRGRAVRLLPAHARDRRRRDRGHRQARPRPHEHAHAPCVASKQSESKACLA